MILILNVQWKILRYSCYHLVTSAKKSPDNSGLNNKRLCSYLFEDDLEADFDPPLDAPLEELLEAPFEELLEAAFLGAAFFAAAFLGAAFLAVAMIF